MAVSRISSRYQVLILILFVFLLGSRYQKALAADSYPAAPTITDAHRYFDSLVASNGVSALYETLSRDGFVLGYENFPVRQYNWSACRSGLILKNGVKLGVDWKVVEKSPFSDGTLNILRGHNVQFTFFHMITVEGGIAVEPTTQLPRLILAINDELSRDRLAKAMELLSSACRVKSKFD